MPDPEKQLVAILGPTAVGKTEVAIALAEEFEARGLSSTAVSADAYQLYRGLEILSGAPSDEERARLAHELVGTHALDEEMSAGRYAQEAHLAIDEILASGSVPIVVGGAGFYMQAALTALDMRPPLTPEQEEAAQEQYGQVETRELHRMLAEADASAAQEIDPADRYRTVRALALLDAGHQPSPGDSFWQAPLRRPSLLFGLTREREELYALIDARVDAMVAAGAAAEIAHAQEAGVSSTARKIIGFEELPAGQVDEMRQRTRRYAKRQLTWMRRVPGLETVDLSALTPAAAAQVIAQAWDARAE